MALPVWKILLLNRATLEPYGEFTQFSAASYTKRLNAAGSATLNCSLADPLSRLIEPLSTVLAFERNGIIVWSGPIMNRDEALPERSVTVQAVGFFDVLMKRIFRANRTSFNEVDAGQIAAAIVSEANAQSPTGITVTTVEATVPRSKTYMRYASMGQAIVELSQFESGYDFEVVGTEMRIYAEQGIDRSASSDPGVAQCILGYQALRQNIATFSRKVDTGTFTNRLSAITTGSVEVVEDTDSVQQYGLYETSESLGLVSSDVGRAYAAAEIAVRGLPLETIALTLQATDEDERVPRFDGNGADDRHYFQLGDKVQVTVQDPDLPQINSAFRVFGATVSLDASGVERVTDLQLAAPLRTNISTIGMVFRDSGGAFTSSIAGNPTSPITIDRDGFRVISIPYVNIASQGVWIVGDAGFSVLGVSTVLA